MDNRFHIVESVDQISLRLYSKDQHSDKPYENEEDYECLLIVNFETPEVAYISKWISKVPLNKHDILTIYQKLRDLGLTSIRYYRHGKLREIDLYGKGKKIS